MEKKHPVQVNTFIEELGRYGAAVLGISRVAFTEVGFENGDIVEVWIGSICLTMPVVSGYFDVDSGQILMLNTEFEPRMMISRTNSNTFAQDYALKIGDPVSVTMKEKGGYLEEFRRRELTMGTSRKDYSSDAAFCNFRSVDLPEVKKHYLYRGFSPINPTDHRARETDRLLSRTRVKTIINLDGEDLETRRRYPDYEESFYAGRTVIPVSFPFDPASPGFVPGMQKILQAITEEKGPFYIHCRYGRDRTGVVCMVLEAICGASLEELVEDYMLSYEIIHGLVRYSDKWYLHAEKRAYASFTALTGLTEKNLSGQQTQTAMLQMLRERCDIPEDTLQQAMEVLSADP